MAIFKRVKEWSFSLVLYLSLLANISLDWQTHYRASLQYELRP